MSEWLGEWCVRSLPLCFQVVEWHCFDIASLHHNTSFSTLLFSSVSQGLHSGVMTVPGRYGTLIVPSNFLLWGMYVEWVGTRCCTQQTSDFHLKVRADLSNISSKATQWCLHLPGYSGLHPGFWPSVGHCGLLNHHVTPGWTLYFFHSVHTSY